MMPFEIILDPTPEQAPVRKLDARTYYCGQHFKLMLGAGALPGWRKNIHGRCPLDRRRHRDDELTHRALACSGPDKAAHRVRACAREAVESRHCRKCPIDCLGAKLITSR